MTCSIFYVAHPLGGDVPANLARAMRWLRWLIACEPDVAFIAPWIASVSAGEDDADPAQRARGLRDAEAVIARCDGIVLCGGLSPGMQQELAAARRDGLHVLDFSHRAEPDGLPARMPAAWRTPRNRP